MLRRMTIAALVSLIPALIPVPASAASVWDPNDVEGPFDIRWFGAAFTSTGEIHLGVSFYEGFDPSMIPLGFDPRTSYVRVKLTPALDGSFIRRSNGRIVFIWGDYASSCCEVAPVARPAPDVLSVVFDPFSYVFGDTVYTPRAVSSWHTVDGAHPDWTRSLPIGPPSGGSG
ncbi:MAG: hypothetical protein ACXWX5_04265 [Actinomycetota bacterium]